MRFIDEARIKISAGHGGKGCVSFRREKYIPRGGPDGGDGGRGGNVIFTSTIQLGTLQDFRFKRSYAADNGQPGSGKNKAGRDGEDILIKVPVGTVIKDQESSEILFDFTEDAQTWVAAKGGRGGKGNAHFVSSTFQAPKYSQPGEEGGSLALQLELKLLADVGLVGFPNAGKSTFISRVSAAHPKVADYPFTTLIPNLGVVQVENYKSFVVADIPGLIEGAHQGSGLGIKFLKHVERTRVILHLLDGTQVLDFITRDPSTPATVEAAAQELLKLYATIRRELELYNPDMVHKREIIAINKVDLFSDQMDFIQAVQKELARLLEKSEATRKRKLESYEPMLISSASGESIQMVVHRLWEHLEQEKHSEVPTVVKVGADS